MAKVFNHTTSASDPLWRAIDALRVSSSAERSAVAINVMCDHRIGERCEQRFRNEFTRCGNRLNAGLLDYFMRNVRFAEKPDFLKDDLNAENIVSGVPTAAIPSMKPDTQLVRVLNLNGLRKVFADAFDDAAWEQELRAWLVKVPGITFPTDFALFLDGILEDASSEERSSFVDLTLRIIEARRLKGRMKPTCRYEPTWAALWDEFEEHVEAGADRWRQVVGIPSSGSRDWLILLRYTVAEAGTMVWPTQLEAGPEACHFPTPPDATRVRGHPVDLAQPSPGHRLRMEFIHQQIPHTLSHFLEAGSRMESTSGAQEDVGIARVAHHGHLIGEYGAAVRSWMDRAV